jgi:hypothetical protein
MTAVCFIAQLRGLSDPISTVDETEDFLSSIIPPASRSHIFDAPLTVHVKPEPRDLSLDCEPLPSSAVLTIG